MASFVHIADVHLGFEQYQLTDRFRDFGTAFRTAIEEAISLHVDFILVGGDLFNKRAINARTLIQAKKVLEMAQDAGVPVVVVEGNHDMSYYRDQESWLSYLRHDDLIILLEPTLSADGTVVFDPWNERRRRGGYIEIGDARIFGLGWLGASTEAIAKQAAASIRSMAGAQQQNLQHDSNSGITDTSQKDGRPFTILMLHAGIEGYVPKMSGCIGAGALAPLRDCVDYLALGHIHKGYDQDDWLFNPGSLETWNSSELNWRRGMYHVVFSRDGIGNVEHIDGSRWRRPFEKWVIDLGAAVDPEDALRIVQEYVARCVDGTGNGGRGQTIGTDQANSREHANSTEQTNRTDRANGTARKRDTGPNATLAPVIHLNLTGVVRFDRHLIDTDAMHELITRRAAPLHIVMKNDTRSPDFDFEVDGSGTIAREVLERDVVRNLIGNDERFADAAESLSSLILDIKDNPGRPPEATSGEIRGWAREQRMLIKDSRTAVTSSTGSEGG